MSRLSLAAVTALAIASGTASADGTLSMRGVYYKERATRVVQPMLDGMFDVGARGTLAAHLLVDAITSASASSGADNSKPFTERRIEGGAAYTHELSNLRLGAEGKYSTESDYKSIFAGVRAEADLFQKNTTVGVGGGYAHDKASAGSAQGLAQPMVACSATKTAVECPLDSYSAFASLTQILGKNLVGGLSYDYSYLDGYQSNPYRTAITDTGEVSERNPTERTRQSVAGTVRLFVPQTHTALIGAYRYYWDDWEVHAHTPELRIIQQVSYVADASLRYRYHHQDGAFFYQERYATGDVTMQPYVTDDVKLDTFTGHTFEAKLGVFGEAFGAGGRWAGARFEGILEYVLQHPRFGNAIIGQFALTVPFDY
ncbi:hypothetical protein BH11MYX2_BH11MYX2_36330 [soil metagenome]